MRQKSLWTKVAVGVILFAFSFAVIAGSISSPVYAHSSGGWGGGSWGGGSGGSWGGSGSWGGGRSWGGSWGGGRSWGGSYCCSYSYSYYPYYSGYYCGYGYYTYCSSPYYYGSYPYYNGYSNYYGANSAYSSAQYQLTVNTNPTSLASQVTGGGSYSYGSSASFSVSQAIVQTAPDTQYVFQGWTGGYSGSATSGSITMTSSATVTANYQPQYLLTVSAQPSGAPSPQGSGWFNSGSTASISVPSPIVSQNAGSQLAFNGWTVDGSSNQGGSTLSLQMNSPHVVVAQYVQQYYLTVQSPQGVTSGQGWYNAGSNAPISVSTPPSPMFGVNYVFDGWQGSIQSSSQSTTVLMNGPMTVTATWHQDYTVLYITIGAIIAIIAVAAFALIYTTKNRKEPNPPPQQVQPMQQVPNKTEN